jgi:glycosyltransferase involved in cell wall biosynthesis
MSSDPKQTPRICVIGFDDDKVIKDFIRLHVERLPGTKTCIDNWYPDYRYQGRLIRLFFSQRPFLAKALKCLPHFLYHRIVVAKQLSDSSLLDAYTGFFRTHRTDVILAEFGENGSSITPIAKQLQIPLVVHFHGHDAHRQPLFTSELLASYQRLFDYASAVLAVSSLMVQRLISLGCPANKIIYNPYGPREKFFDIRPDYRPSILSVGRFTDIKANYLVLMAFKEALNHVPEAKLQMAGTGELLETCKTLARVWNLDRHVDFLGAVPHAEVADLFSRNCCFAQHSITPTYGDAEGTPNTILEASAAGLPVISTKHAGINDVVVDGVTGFLVDEADVNFMGKRMVELLKNRKLCERMGESARTRITQYFSIDKHISRISEAIDAALLKNENGIQRLSEQSFQDYSLLSFGKTIT